MRHTREKTLMLKSGCGFVAGIAALMAMFISLVLVISGSMNPSGTHATASLPAVAPMTIDIELGDMFIHPASISVPSGTIVTFHVKNSGVMAHDFRTESGVGFDAIQPGTTKDVTTSPLTAVSSAWCTIAGHKQAGMTLAINVVGAPIANGSPAAVPSVGLDAVIDAAAMPSAGWTGRNPLLQDASNKTVHNIAFDATESIIEVAPGVTQEMWTFNGMVPGPVLRGNIGDTFRITLTNRGKMGHSIDFHASKVAWSDEMRTILPGESLVYEFTAQFAGAFMYHCGTGPALHHIGNGMYGVIIIDPPHLAPVEKEFFITQSELYLGPQGQPGDLTKMLHEQWDAVVFNGYFNQYKFDPIHVLPGKRYRIWVLNDGPSENSAFHIVGTIFDTVYKEGAYLLKPNASHGGSQVLDLQPAQGGFVEFTFAVDGLYPFVTHKFANVGKGALGFFVVGNADASALGNH
jgi:nitrite reductase (NO-forming)